MVGSIRLLALLVFLGILAGSAHASSVLKGEDADKFLDSLRIPVSGMKAARDLVGTHVPLQTSDGFLIYHFREMLVTVERPAPHHDRITGKYFAGKTPKSLCIDFKGRAANYCVDIVFANGEVAITMKGQTLKGVPYSDAPTMLGPARPMPKAVADAIHQQAQCLCFQEIAREAAKGDFRAVMEKFEPDGSEWYENGEPFFDAVLNVQPWYRPCLVNEGSNLLFCQTADLINASKSQVAQFEQQQNRLVQKCFGKAPAGRSTKADNLMQGTEWWITDTLTAYSMKGAHHVSGSADHQLFLVTFHIGKRKRS